MTEAKESQVFIERALYLQSKLSCRLTDNRVIDLQEAIISRRRCKKREEVKVTKVCQ